MKHDGVTIEVYNRVLLDNLEIGAVVRVTPDHVVIMLENGDEFVVWPAQILAATGGAIELDPGTVDAELRDAAFDDDDEPVRSNTWLFKIGRPEHGSPVCRVCEQPLEPDDASLIDIRSDYDDEGFEGQTWMNSHLACAIATRRDELRAHLLEIDREDLRRVIAGVRAASPELASEIAHRVPPDRKAIPLDDPRTQQLLARLDETPGDRELLAVLGDHLSDRGDERGELIALQLAGDSTPRVTELQEILSIRGGLADKQDWGIGFLREVSIILGGHPLSIREVELANPSCRLVQQLTIWQNRPFENNYERVLLPPALVPRGLRVLDVIGGLAPIDLSMLPYLETIVLDQCDEIVHPTARTLELRATDGETIAACAKGLPRVERLKIERLRFGREPPGELGRLLVETGWLARLRELELQGIAPDRELRDAAHVHGIRLIETPMFGA